MFSSYPKPTREKKKRKWIQKVGKRGKRNIEANRELKRKFQESGITICEEHGIRCPNGNWLSFAHRHKRSWYYGREDLLSAINQVILVCVPYHAIMEKDSKLTERVFLLKRGPEL